MPISATGSNGFTLVELAVVLAIVGLATAVVVETIPDPRGTIRSEAARFAAKIDAARSAAIVESRDMQVTVDGAGYRFAERRRGQWLAIPGRAFAAISWTQGTAPDAARQITFDTTGAPAAPATVALARSNARATVSIAEDGGVRVAP